MNNQENKSRRTLKNSDYNKILENTVNTEDGNKQIPETVQNTQEKQVNENQQINIESSPALYSRDQIINNQAIPVQVPAQQNHNLYQNENIPFEPNGKKMNGNGKYFARNDKQQRRARKINRRNNGRIVCIRKAGQKHEKNKV